ncbi:hypothetical protein MAJ_07108, partial [Metarhizium majus ARSEF 297]
MAPKPTDMHPSRLSLNTSESTSTAQARPPSRPESQKSLIPKARDDRAVPHIESAPPKSGKEEEIDKLPQFVGFQPTPSVSKARSKLPLRQHIKRKSYEFKHGPSHLTSPVLLHNEMSVEAAVAQLEATPKQPAFSTPSQIENKIGLFESLIAKEKTNVKSKYSIRYKARIPASVSCQVVHQPKPGITEEVRRKSSSSWGPARWRQRPIVQNIEAEHHAAQDEPKSVSRKGEDQRVPTDEPMEMVRSSLSGNWEIWTDNINNSEKETKSDGSLPRVSSIHHPESDTQQPQNDPASVGSYAGQWGQGAKSMQVTQTGERRRTWRLSGRRWTSRSNTPFIARVNCALEQPQPVRVNEMKRLASLCREKMTMRKDRAQTD